MATITTNTYLDGGTARTAGETWTVNSGAILTVRTDTRWHANAPASMTGSLGSQTINEGEILYDGRNVRWLQFNSGSGTVPAIGTNITQAGVTSSYLLGVWSSLTSAPTAVGAAMPTTGFIKFREVAGTFAAGALTGISANALSADKTGWIEIVSDSSATITVPRLGKQTIRGDWFYLDDTNGSVGQVIQVPTNGGGATTYCPGLWIETAPSSNVYEYWTALTGAANGWSRVHIGGAYTETDKRQSFVSSLGSGQLQIGEASNLAGTYTSTAAQASTYAANTQASTYTWTANLITVTYASGHQFNNGQSIGLVFTTGGATAYSGIFTITVIDAYTYTVPLAGSGTGGSVNAKGTVTITFTSHGLGVGDVIYCDATTGGLPDGSYTITAVTAANTYLIGYPNLVTVASGNVSVYSTYTITYTAHGLAVGNRVYLEFTSGAGVSGLYTILAVAANTFTVLLNNGTTADSGNVNIKQTIGHIPPSGCKIRIPNVFLREAATATRATNMVNATVATRPEYSTTSAGNIDHEFAYSTWYYNINQPASFKAYNSSTFDTIVITECANIIDIDNFNTSMHSGLDTQTLTLTSNFAGSNIKNSCYLRGNTPAASDHSVNASYCFNLNFDNVVAGIIQYVRSSGYGINFSYCSNILIDNCHILNTTIYVSASNGFTVTNHNHIDRIIGYTNSTSAQSAITFAAGSSNCKVEGVTWGYNNAVINCHPYTSIVSSSNVSGLKVRNLGTFASRLACGSWRPNIYNMGSAYTTNGNNSNVKLQRIYLCEKGRSAVFTTVNSDKFVLIESIYGGIYSLATQGINLIVDTGLNSIISGCRNGSNSVAGQASVYGSHFFDIFLGDTTGRFVLAFNEPTTETSTQFTMVSGTTKFNSSGGLLMGVIGDQCIIEDSIFRKGHTGFQNITPVMSGGTIGNYTLEYQIDLGSGYSGSWTTLNGTNLSAITLDPSIGYKMKYRITTTSTNTTAITFIKIDTLTTAVAQSSNLYPLDLSTIQVYGYVSGSDIVILSAGTSIELANADSVTGSSYSIQRDPNDYPFIDVCVYKKGYVPFVLRNISFTSDGVSLPINQVIDRNYIE